MAIALSKEKVTAQHSLMIIYSFLAFLLVNLVVIYLANTFFPLRVVLGTGTIPFLWALCHSVGKLTVVNTFVLLLVTYYEWKRGKAFTTQEWMGTFLLTNFAALYVISRFAANLGLGLSAWWVVLFLSAILDWLQGLAMMTLAKYVK